MTRFSEQEQQLLLQKKWEEIILGLKKKSKSDLNLLKDIVNDAGGFTYAEQKIDEFNHHALDAISPYPDSPYKQSMVDLISFNAQRTG